MMTFDDFWDLYGKKVDRKKCIAKWKRLKFIEKEKIAEHLPKYVESTPILKYRKNPLTYLNGECWEDDIIFYHKAKEIEVNEPELVNVDFKKYG